MTNDERKAWVADMHRDPVPLAPRAGDEPASTCECHGEHPDCLCQGADECVTCGARFNATRADKFPICRTCRKPPTKETP